MRLRSWGATFISAAAIATSVGAGAAVAEPAPTTVTSRYVDSAIVNGIPTFGAISGIDRLANAEYAMISTDVGRAGPARFYTSHVGYNSEAGLLGRPQVTLGGGTVLSPQNLPLLPGDAQFEGIRRLGGGYVVVSGGNHQFIRQIGPMGTFVRDLALPKAWRPTKKTGVNGQKGLTGVTVGPNGEISVITAGALRQDPGGTARLLTYAGRGTKEFVYRPGGGRVVADVLAVNTTDYLVLERGKGRVTRIFWATTDGAQQVGGSAKLSGGEKAMRKVEIFSTEPVPRLAAGNMSSMAWGNWLADRPGSKSRARMLYVVTNDMFAGPTRLHAFEVRFPRS
ncbi:esterase-like activity of phytase family protein [Gordonia desulfuricans]|uniref:Esterase-like activity of phytase family protein n=1 Tax=Gordonia desulfuricans TaxID=89051 RepID=A0A7K3LKZ4_9ACTN|nr:MULTISPECIES: esterase-like activity of phytase family protein [Gordonia]EMP15372.1 hypothetical protein ISGA_1499 [Gordonia sp. NB41Y]NDK88910.1 esterase-like activity of phytase family protein [Gordonia desulfuricans]WLP88921.1 esterase-like activity of phytase family protein [Gordonia sp. NB41Y]